MEQQQLKYFVNHIKQHLQRPLVLNQCLMGFMYNTLTDVRNISAFYIIDNCNLKY
jgi:hypothetical protein